MTERTGQPSPKVKPSVTVSPADAANGAVGGPVNRPITTDGTAKMRSLRPTLVASNVRTAGSGDAPVSARIPGSKSSTMARGAIDASSTFKIVSPLALPSAGSPIDGPIPDDDAYRAATAGALRQRLPQPREIVKATVSHRSTMRSTAEFADAVNVRAHRSVVPSANAAKHEAAMQAPAHGNERISKPRAVDDKPSPLWRIVTLSSDAVVLTFALPYMAVWYAARALRRLVRSG